MQGLPTPSYPWYTIVDGADLEQGDLIRDCPILRMDLAQMEADGYVDFEKQNGIILTQSCDLRLRENGRCKADQVVLCPVHSLADFEQGHAFRDPKQWEEARKGRRFSYTVLNKCDLGDDPYECLLVDLSSLFCVSVGVLRGLAEQQGKRARLNPPYREHLSQAFARFFMRVGLPVDIPSFSD